MILALVPSQMMDFLTYGADRQVLLSKTDR